MAQVQSISPCLWFNGQAEAAAAFYVSVFPDSRLKEVMRWPEVVSQFEFSTAAARVL